MSSNEISFGSRPDRQLGYLLSNFTKPGRAFIPGCGFGGSVLILLESGWQVVGLDKHQEALGFIESKATQGQRKKLKLICADLIDYNFSKLGLFDLIIVSNLLHFFDRAGAINMIKSFQSKLRTRGIMLIRVFTDRDFLVTHSPPGRFYPSEQDLKKLTSGMKTIRSETRSFEDNHPPYGPHPHISSELVLQKLPRRKFVPRS